MKTIFAVLAFCLVASYAAAAREEPSNQISVIENIIQEVNDFALSVEQALEQKYQQIVLDPLRKLDATLTAIDERGKKDKACVNDATSSINRIIDDLHTDVNTCGVVAAQTAANIVIDVEKAGQQVIFGGYDVLKTFQRCQNYKNDKLKQTCMARWTVQAGLYVKNARRSIDTIKDSANKRIPAVFTDAEACTRKAGEKANTGLNNVITTIDKCLG